MSAYDVSVEFAEKVANLPQKPGVYQYYNDEGKLIYIGKAIKLRNRVKQYFNYGRKTDAKTQALIKHIRNVQVIVTDSEAEALILEDTLIKQHKPKYNIMLRDDKSFPFIRITNETYPRIFPTRTIIRDGSKYIGPFTDVRSMKHLLKTINTLFKFRSCEHNITDETIEKGKYKICLDFQIHKCEGPCEGRIAKEIYNDNIKHAISIINGKTKEIEKIYEEKMLYFSDEFMFEEAAQMRNRLMMLRDYSSKQKVVSNDYADRDVFGIARNDDDACTLVFKVRDGKLVARMHYIIKNALNDSDEEIMSRTLQRWYIENDFVPPEIFLPCEPDELEYLSTWLGEKREKSVHLIIPKIGDKRKLVEMASTNAEFMLKEHRMLMEQRDQVVPRPVLSLQRDLRLKNMPRLIECFDNSHLQGTELVSSMVCFEDGRPKKSEYRKFKNKTVLQNDDFATMREVILRRYSRLIEEIEAYKNQEKEESKLKKNKDGLIKKVSDKIPRLPDLIIIDGGKGQLSSAMGILKELGIDKKVEVIGLAKRLEEVFFPGESEAVLLPRTSSSLRLIQQLRDEAHRFAITYHRTLRDKRILQTELTNIKGIGETTANKLLREIGSVELIKNADDEQLIKYLNSKQIKLLRDWFANSNKEDENIEDESLNDESLEQDISNDVTIYNDTVEEDSIIEEIESESNNQED